MKNFICCSLTALFLVLDMLAGNISLFPAFSVYAALIFFLAYGWKYGVVSALFSGMVLDALYGHSFSYLSLIFLIAVILGAITAERGHRQLLSLFAAGAVAGSVAALGIIFAVKISGGTLPAPDRITYLLFGAGAGGSWMLIAVMLFDFFAVRANLPRCVRNVFSEPVRHRRRPVSRTASGVNSGRKRP